MAQRKRNLQGTEQIRKYQGIIEHMKLQLIKENKIAPRNELEFSILMNALRIFEADLEALQK